MLLENLVSNRIMIRISFFDSEVFVVNYVIGI